MHSPTDLRPEGHRASVPVGGHPGIDSRNPLRLTTPTTGLRRPAAAAAMAATLALAGVPAAPDLGTPTLIVADRSCTVPDPAPSAELAATVSASTAAVLAYPRPAQPVLHDLAHRIAPEACDTTHGRFDVVRLRAWNRHDDDGPTTRDIVRWYGDNDAGAALTSEYPDPWPGVMKDWWWPGFRLELSTAFTSRDLFRWHAEASSGSRDSTVKLLSGFAELATWRNPAPSGRSLAVTELAFTPGLIAYPRVVDRAGRTGIALATITGDGTERYVLILHPVTGHVLAYEHAARTPSGWQPSVYLLLLTRTHADGRWWEPPTTASTAPSVQQADMMLPRQGTVVFSAEPCITQPITAPQERTTR